MRWLLLAALVVALDQGTKFLATAHLELYEPREVLSFFNLTLLHNTGAAFSFLNDAGGWQRWALSGLAVIVSAVIMFWLPRLGRVRYHLPLALALILGGTLGNLVDRAVLGYVVDFLDFHAGGWHWPAFNIADSAISVGALILIIDTLRQQPRDAPGRS